MNIWKLQTMEIPIQGEEESVTIYLQIPVRLVFLLFTLIQAELIALCLLVVNQGG